MCKSKIKIKKFIKLLLEVEFYNIVIYTIFCLTGVTTFDSYSCVIAIFPITSVAQNFAPCFLLFYLFIPYINKLIENISKKELEKLILLMFFVYSVLGNIPKFDIVMNYLTLFTYIYLIGAYIRIYPMKWFSNKKVVNLVTLGLVALCICSVIYCLYIGEKVNTKMEFYFISDSNKILAVLTSISLFLFFKNLNIKYNKVINTMATSIFGVLLIHANSEAMRIFLWEKVFNNVDMYDTNYIYIHAILSVIGIFIVCTLIDQIRIRFIEKPFFEKVIDKKLENK